MMPAFLIPSDVAHESILPYAMTVEEAQKGLGLRYQTPFEHNHTRIKLPTLHQPSVPTMDKQFWLMYKVILLPLWPGRLGWDQDGPANDAWQD